MFGIEKDFQQLMEQVYGPLNKDKMTDLKFASPSGETTIKVQDTGRLGTVAPKTQLHIKMDEPVQYETPMTEIEEIKAQINVLQSKLSFLEELEKTKSPAEEAYRRWWGEYPSDDNGWEIDNTRWRGFRVGYNYAQKDYKVGEWEPTPQTPEQVADGLKEAFREAVKQGVVSSSTKKQTLYELIADWWDEIFMNGNPSGQNIESLVEQIEREWLPKEHDTNSYKWNECIRTIKSKLR